jgi:catechol 2,3-dioxygenase-like lactoylglutathione lyase family enzyme
MADAKDVLQVIQIGASTSDLPGTVRLFADAFGFQNAGGQGLWGKTIGIQGLPPDSRAIMWWLVGAQSFFQLEFFHHTKPAQRPKRKDWTPADHGWCRFGVATADFDTCLQTLTAFEIKTVTAPINENGLRRVAFIEPYLAVAVEVIEKKKTGNAKADGPDIVYFTSSVADLESARGFYRDALGFEVGENNLHTPAHEALWGLKDAKRETFVARGAGDILLEVVQYSHPVGRPKPDDYRNSDQGIMNICVGSRDPAAVARVMNRALATGLKAPMVLNFDEAVCCYTLDAGRELEFAAIPESRDLEAGFIAVTPFFG